jgi:transcription antitermination factor NusB
MRKKRRASRERLLQVLYAWASRGYGDEEYFVPKDMSLVDPRPGRPEDIKFTKSMIQLFEEKMDEVDKYISGASDNWRIERMDVVDLAVLRLAVTEIAFLQTPAPVAINEAVDLAKLYGSERSGGFVNGILHKISQNFKK